MTSSSPGDEVRLHHRGRLALGAGRPRVVLWGSYAFLLAGVNLINPLLPTIRSDLRVGTGGVATAYSLYLVALVPLLLLLPRVRWAATPRTRLLIAVGLVAGSDVLHAVGHVVALGTGRLVLAASVAVGTAAVAELAVLLAGSEGRTVTATANTAGALIGTALGGVALLLLRSPVQVVFLAHAVLAVVLPVAIVRLVPDVRAGTAGPAAGARQAHGRRDGVILGGIAFAAGAAAIVLGPALFEQSAERLGGRATLVPLVIYLAAAAAQSHVRTSRASIYLGNALILAGLALLVWSLAAGSFPLLVVGSAMTGAGFGAVFMLGLAWTTHGVEAGDQGSLASTYACIAYAAAAAVTIGCGFLADHAGAVAALLVILVGAALACCAWAVLSRRSVDPFAPSAARPHCGQDAGSGAP